MCLPIFTFIRHLVSWVIRFVLNVLISWCIPSKILSVSLPFVSKTLKNYPKLTSFISSLKLTPLLLLHQAKFFPGVC